MKKKQITFTFLEHDAVSKNGRVYTKDAVQDMVRRAQEDIAQGRVLSSFATHDYARTEDPTRMVGKLSKVWEDGTKVKATLDLFDTAHAQELAHIVKEQGIKTVSLRADEYDVTGKKTIIDGKEHDQVSLCHLAGVDFAMRPGISMVNIDPVTYESDDTSKAHREIVACENDPQHVILVEEADKGGLVMDPEEIKRLVAEQFAALSAANAQEGASHAHPHKHDGGDGKKYTHEHKHAHSSADSKNEDHLHEHGNPYEDLGAYSIADLSRAIAERVTLYVGDGTPASVLEPVAAKLSESIATLKTANIIKESANPLESQLTEEVAKAKTLNETLITFAAETETLKKALAEEQAKTAKVEAEAEDLAKKLLEAARPDGRRAPVKQIIEQALTEIGVSDGDREIPAGKEYQVGIRGFAAALAAHADA